MIRVSMYVNGERVSHVVEDSTLLVEYLRETLKLTGTHVGCDTSQCGCCTIHIDGVSAKSCTVLAAQAEGRQVTTIEGLASKDGSLHPMQEAFRTCHGLQCGFCTPGQIMAATELLRTWDGALDEYRVREEMEGNLCRCTGYHNIIKAILSVHAQMGSNADAHIDGEAETREGTA